MFRILTIDDHDIVLEGIKGIFAKPTGVAEFGEARNRDEALQHVRDKNWDIAVLDISLDGHSGLDVLKEIKEIRPHLPVLMLSMYAESQYAKRAFKAGAAGYVTKGSSSDELRSAILKVIKGGRYVSSKMAEQMVVEISSSDKAPHERLSDRELEVLCMIASGKTVGDIAAQLALSDKTISTYRRRILDKMGMNSSAELTHFAIRNGLVE